MVEEYDEPWGAQVVIAAKTHKVNVTWHEYHWRMCVSYRKLNQITHSFDFRITIYDYKVQDINKETKYSLLWTWTVDIENYWWKKRHVKYWNYSPRIESGGVK